MRFWDASALVPLLFSESTSETISSLVKEDQDLVVWWSSGLECASAIRRRERDGTLTSDAVTHSLKRLDSLAAIWSEILPGNELRSHATRLLATHSLRASDALQLAAAIVWRRDPGAKVDFVCLDDRLSDAATREGFLGLPIRL